MQEFEGVKHLYNTKDVAAVREQLLQLQNYIDPITGYPIPKGSAVLDHDHKTHYVRSVLHRQTNAVLGKLENSWTRYLAWWYEGTLPQFLRGCADYLEKEHPTEYLHPAFLKHLQVQFNKLPEGSKKDVLESLQQAQGSNGAQRKQIFSTFLKAKTHGMKAILQIIQRKQDV